MLIGFGLAFVVADIYWPQDRWVALITMIGAVPDDRAAARLLGAHRDPARRWSSATRCPGSWTRRRVTSRRSTPATGEVDTHPRVNFDAVKDADWFGFPDFTGPDFKFSAILLVLPAVIALIAENTGHVKAVGAMTKTRPRPDDRPGDLRRRRRHRGGHVGRRLADHDVRREHRRHGGHPHLLDRGLLRGRRRRDPVRPVPEVRRAGRGDARRRARRRSPSCSTG